MSVATEALARLERRAEAAGLSVEAYLVEQRRAESASYVPPCLCCGALHDLDDDCVQGARS